MAPSSEQALDVRDVPKPQRHPLIFGRFASLAVGESFELVNNHDPKPLRAEFERDQPGAFSWEYRESGPSVWRIAIGRVAPAPSPQVLCNVHDVLAAHAAETSNRAAWALGVGERHLDSNVIRLGPGNRVDEHTGPDLDVIMLILAGSGEVATSSDALAVSTGSLIWLPRRSRRAIQAGPDGLAYLTVHPRRPGLQITTR